MESSRVLENRSGENAGGLGFNFDNTYARLPDYFHARLGPVPVRQPRMVVLNRSLAESLGMNADELAGEDGAWVLSGSRIPQGAEPLAQAYAGHQFGSFTMLGDGRAILLGEHITPDGRRFDIQLKGSGQTPFSRLGDGRAALGPMLREYIISEAMHALGIPTSRSLAVVATGEPVFRETVLAGAVLTRVSASHIRVGTFEYVARRGGPEGVGALADYTLARHYPDVSASDNPGLALLHAVMERQASLVARWLGVGFIHGVMNTDNMALSGETIDYGPCAFMDAYDPATVFSSIDQSGRYAFGNQPNMAQWNLARLAETLLPILHPEQGKAIAVAEEAVKSFPDRFRRHWLAIMRAKLGLLTEEEDDLSLAQALLQCMHETRADYTITFRDLSVEAPSDPPWLRSAAFREWHARWQARLARQAMPMAASRELMRWSNPAVIPRNHRVEEALDAAVERGDLGVMERLLDVLASPYEESPRSADYRDPAPPSDRPYRTFCGT
jgi:uncharacterized protein YdiU (UPF0061 family)